MIQRILHILSSISLLAVIYLINNGIGVGTLLGGIGIYVKYDLPQWVSYVAYVVSAIGFAGGLILSFNPHCSDFLPRNFLSTALED